MERAIKATIFNIVLFKSFYLHAAVLGSQEPKTVTTSIFDAIEKRDYEGVTYWCDFGHANTRENRDNRRTPLAVAIKQVTDEKIVGLLLTHKCPAKVDEEVYPGWRISTMPLEIAVNAVSSIIEDTGKHSVGFERKEGDGELNAQEKAHCEKYRNIIKLLLLHRANPEAYKNPCTPLLKLLRCQFLSPYSSSQCSFASVGEDVGVELLRYGACSSIVLNAVGAFRPSMSIYALATLRAMHQKIKPIAIQHMAQAICCLPNELPNLIAEYLWPISWGNSDHIFGLFPKKAQAELREKHSQAAFLKECSEGEGSNFSFGNQERARQAYQEYLAKKNRCTA